MGNKRKNEPVVVTMTRQTAREHGLVFCVCGHPENNHFDFGENAQSSLGLAEGRPCAHCGCRQLDESNWRKGIREIGR